MARLAEVLARLSRTAAPAALDRTRSRAREWPLERLYLTGRFADERGAHWVLANMPMLDSSWEEVEWIDLADTDDQFLARRPEAAAFPEQGPVRAADFSPN